VWLVVGCVGRVDAGWVGLVETGCDPGARVRTPWGCASTGLG
jgi:hypothetical protein